MELSMRQIFFCKIDQIQVVWEMRIFYYCMSCLRATSKQRDDLSYAKHRNFSSVVLKMNNDQEESMSSAVYKYDKHKRCFFKKIPWLSRRISMMVSLLLKKFSSKQF